jgi:hypothetical protein
MECRLYFCANAYNTSVENGEVFQHQLDSLRTGEKNSWSAAGIWNSTTYQEWDEKHPSLSHQTTEDFIQRSDLQLSIPDSQAVLLGERRHEEI